MSALDPTQKKHYCHSKTLAEELKIGNAIRGDGKVVWWGNSGRQIIVDDAMPTNGKFYSEDTPEAQAVIQMRRDQAKAAPWPLGEGRKDDQGKDRFELLPPEPLFGIARVLTFGAKKYADRNWEKGMAWGRPFGAMMRHMWAWWGGAGPTTKSFLFGELDDETGFSHLWHAGCCLFFLIAYEERKIGTDDRATGGADQRS